MKQLWFGSVGILLLLVPMGCGGEQAAIVTVTPGVTSTIAAQATVVVPDMPGGLCVEPSIEPPVEPVVQEFSVWQDFMPSLQREGAPLHASLVIEVQVPEKLTPASAYGTIKIVRAGGEEVITGNLQLNQSADDLGLGYPGPQPVSFTMAPATITAQLVEGELLHGSAMITLGQSSIEITLPETALLFTQ